MGNGAGRWYQAVRLTPSPTPCLDTERTSGRSRPLLLRKETNDVTDGNDGQAYLQVRNWDRFQHYKHRTPPWIKLHTRILSDYETSQLSDSELGLLARIWMLASRLENRIPGDPAWIRRQIGGTGSVDVEKLVSLGFLVREQNASNMLASCKQDADSEKSRVETEAPNGAVPTGVTRVTDVDRVWDYLLAARSSLGMNGNLTDGRQLIGARLKKYSAADLCRAIDGARSNEWAIARPSRFHPNHIFRNNKNTERYVQDGQSSGRDFGDPYMGRGS